MESNASWAIAELAVGGQTRQKTKASRLVLVKLAMSEISGRRNKISPPSSGNRFEYALSLVIRFNH